MTGNANEVRRRTTRLSHEQPEMSESGVTTTTVVWTDGSCNANGIQGRGGWAALIEQAGTVRENGPVKNRGLWEQLFGLVWDGPRVVTFTWIKGHTTRYPNNNRVDELAQAAALSAG